VGLIFKWLYQYGVGIGNNGGASGAEVVGGYLMVGTITGILMALFLNNGVALGIMLRSLLKLALMEARNLIPIKHLWLVILWVIRSRIPPVLHSMCLLNC